MEKNCASVRMAKSRYLHMDNTQTDTHKQQERVKERRGKLVYRYKIKVFTFSKYTRIQYTDRPTALYVLH